MPTYLCHGFKWQRRSIIVYVVVQNVDNAAPEYIIRSGSPYSLISSFYTLFDFLPDCVFPPTRSSSIATRTYSIDRSSIATSSVKDDSDSVYRGAIQPNRSRSRGRAGSASGMQLRQPSQYYVESRDKETPMSRKESSNSSRKRSKSDITRNNIPPNSNSLMAYQNSKSQSSPSPPPGQARPFTFSLPDNSSDPVLCQEWSPVKLLEEYDPNDLETASRPCAYVADYVKRIDASCSIVEEIQKYEQRVRCSPVPAVTGPSSDEMLNDKKRDTTKITRAGWFEKLRDQLQQNQEIRWYVVVHGEEDRTWHSERSIRDSRSTLAESRSSFVQHAQQIQQNLDVDAPSMDLEMRRQQLRREFGYDQGGPERLVERRAERRPRTEQKQLPELKTELPIIQSPSPTGAGGRPRTPRTPGKGGLRKLFSRSRTEGDLTS